MPLAPFLLGLVGSLVGRVLASLGMSVITVVGVEAVMGQLKNEVVNAANSLPADVFGLFLLLGGGVAINLTFAAITFRLTLWAMTKATRILGVTS